MDLTGNAGAAIIAKKGNVNFMIRNNTLIWNEKDIPEPTEEELKQWLEEYESNV